MRPRLAALLLSGTVIAVPQARAAGCDLSQVIGYQLVAMKTIEAYIERGQKLRGYKGCQPDRVLVFTDNTGLRCKGMSVQGGDLPRAYVFARSQTDIKLCIGDDMLDMAPAQ